MRVECVGYLVDQAGRTVGGPTPASVTAKDHGLVVKMDWTEYCGEAPSNVVQVVLYGPSADGKFVRWYTSRRISVQRNSQVRL